MNSPACHHLEELLRHAQLSPEIRRSTFSSSNYAFLCAFVAFVFERRITNISLIIIIIYKYGFTGLYTYKNVKQGLSKEVNGLNIYFR